MSATPSFGSGLGTLIGSEIGASDLNAGLNNVNSTAAGFGGAVAPYSNFGASFLGPAGSTINNVNGVAGTVKGYDQYMSEYGGTPAAKYQMQQADEAQNESAASRGGLLSGTNLRALGTINSSIASQNANQAYQEYLQGNQQQFGQLEQSLGNMFNAIGVGTTATGQLGAVDTSQMNNQAQIAQAQAKNDQGKGSGLGSMFSGIGSLPAAF